MINDSEHEKLSSENFMNMARCIVIIEQLKRSHLKEKPCATGKS